jgi:hypothetical protein
MLDAYYKFKRSNNLVDYLNYTTLRMSFNSVRNKKMIVYFKSKELNDFTNSKNYWKFYSSYCRLKSDKLQIILLYQITSHMISSLRPVLKI